VTGSKLSRLKE